MTSMPSFLRIFIVVGEASGDNSAAEIIKRIKLKREHVLFTGCGGPNMRAQGLNTVMDMKHFSLLGIFNVFMAYRRLSKKIDLLVQEAKNFNPDIILTVDAPELSTRFIQRLPKNMGLRAHIGLPSVWFWRPKRVTLFQNLYDVLFAFHPFDIPFFENKNTQCHLVGYPIFDDERLWKADGMAFRKKYHFSPDQTLLCVLPGSRHSEVKNMSPLFVALVQKLRQKYDHFPVIIPIAPYMGEWIKKHFRSLKDVFFIENREEKYLAMQACNIALPTSGTVGLELAACKVPHIMAYKSSFLSRLIVLMLKKTPYTSVINYHAQRFVVPEHTLKGCHIDKMMEDMVLLFEGEAAKKQIEDFNEILKDFFPKCKEKYAERIATLLLAAEKERS